MVPGRYDLTIYRGGTLSVNITASDKDGPIDFGMVYAEAKMFIQKAWYSSVDEIPEQPLFELSTDNGYIIINGTILTLQLPSPVTLGLPFTQGVYDIKLIINQPELIADYLLYGMVNVKSGATP